MLAVATLALIFGVIALRALHTNVAVEAAESTIYVDDDNAAGPWARARTIVSSMHLRRVKLFQRCFGGP
jgi:ribonuclease PH